jgi:hypothetical protein
MAYPECPDCRVPQLVPDESDGYTCFSCFADVRFYRCPWCSHPQTIVKRWTSFTCGRCDRKVDAAVNVAPDETVRARRSEGVGYMYPKM